MEKKSSDQPKNINSLKDRILILSLKELSVLNKSQLFPFFYNMFQAVEVDY
jgi:hypothetical protein